MTRRRLLVAFIVAAGLATAGGLAAIGYVLYVRHEGRDVRGSSTVEFTPSEPEVAVAPPVAPPPRGIATRPPTGRPGKAPRRPVRRVNPALTRADWPTYGFSNLRLRAYPSRLRPPYRTQWIWHGRSLLEFPPAIAYGRLFVATNHGVFSAIAAKTGRVQWRYRAGRCVAASPAVADGLVYEAFLNRPPCNSAKRGLDGEVIAFQQRKGKIRWRRVIGPTESSPAVADGRVLVGDWNGDVTAFAARTGRTLWRTHLGDKIKGAVAVDGNRAYVGSYDGRLHALDTRTGKPIWSASSQARLGGPGSFYSTPALAYGRVYVGSTDGKVYSYGATSGELRWSQSTGGYVYGSPAVYRQRVLVGSYSGRFFALDAATGDVVWTFDAGEPVSGSATVVGDLVYFSTLGRRTFALDARTGREVWRFHDGKYSPVVVDRQRLYLVGYTWIYAMVPKR